MLINLVFLKIKIIIILRRRWCKNWQKCW